MPLENRLLIYLPYAKSYDKKRLIINQQLSRSLAHYKIKNYRKIITILLYVMKTQSHFAYPMKIWIDTVTVPFLMHKGNFCSVLNWC